LAKIGGRIMHIIFLGPPGSGKGTQSDLIVEKYHIPHISTGDMFRAAVNEGTSAGKEAQKYMKAGHLVPDAVTIAIVKERLSKDDCKKGCLLDGFPRTIAQAKALDEICQELGHPIQLVLNLVVDEKALLPRIEGRRLCKVCGATYHLTNNPSKVAGVCDKCGGELYQRNDDNAKSVHTRMQAYYSQSAPLIDYYSCRGICRNIDALRNIEEVFKDIDKILRKL